VSTAVSARYDLRDDLNLRSQTDLALAKAGDKSEARMKRKSFILLGIILVPLVSLGLGACAVLMSHRPVETGLVDGRLRPCPSSPNCVVSEPQNASSIPPLNFTGDPKLAFRSLIDFLEAESNASIITLNEGYVHAVYYTPYLKFADDVEFRLDLEAKVIHARSGSRIGYSDMGANRARIERIRQNWLTPQGE
jgi:uncharacterized protein (DUF1499 family)